MQPLATLREPAPSVVLPAGLAVGGAAAVAGLAKLPAGPACPQCNAAMPLAVLYGLDAIVRHDDVDRGEAIAGGCFIGPDDPEWQCRACGRNW